MKKAKLLNLLLAALLVCSFFSVPFQQEAEAARIGYSYGWSYVPEIDGENGSSWPNFAFTTNEYTYLAGVIGGTVDFDPGAGTDEHTSNDGSDGYLTKLNADGSYAWTKTWGGTGSAGVQGPRLDNQGNLYSR